MRSDGYIPLSELGEEQKRRKHNERAEKIRGFLSSAKDKVVGVANNVRTNVEESRKTSGNTGSFLGGVSNYANQIYGRPTTATPTQTTTKKAFRYSYVKSGKKFVRKKVSVTRRVTQAPKVQPVRNAFGFGSVSAPQSGFGNSSMGSYDSGFGSSSPKKKKPQSYSSSGYW
jgi:hypothetical protein